LCENITLLADNIIKLDFYGKDHVRYERKIEVPENVYNNLSIFMNGKHSNDNLFNLIKSNDVNNYLQDFMKGLSAKVFRTYNASSLFQTELDKITKISNISDILDAFTKANIQVSYLCNHQKKISKSFNNQISVINDKIQELKNKLNDGSKLSKDKKKKIKDKITILNNKKHIKSELKNLALNTSKVNYIDPRITIAFAKKFNIPIEKLLSKSLINKFQWAMSVDKDYSFLK